MYSPVFSRCRSFHHGIAGKHGLFSLLLFMFLLGGCAQNGMQPPATADGGQLLSEWRRIESGLQETGSATAAPGGYVQLGRPVSTAVWADYVYIADAGHQAVLRYDLRRETLSVFYRMQITPETRLLAVAGEYLYIADPLRGRILYLDRNARLLRQITDFNLKKPVAIAEDAQRGRILVADAFYNQILAFNKLGRLIRVLHPVDDTGAAPGGLVDMSVRDGQIYLLDRNLAQVVITDLDGNYRQVLGKDRLRQPVAMVVDEHGRVLVADAFDNVLRVFGPNEQQPVALQPQPLATMQLADMVLHENWLYLVDAAAAQILVMKLHYPVTSTGGGQ